MKLFSSLLCIFSLLLPWREVTAAELPQKLSSAVRAAEADGLSLFKASGQPRTIDNPAIEDARRKITNFCEFDYAPVVISRGGVPVIYFLARPTRSEDIIFGRHFKVVGSDVTTSTRTCFNAGPPPANAAAAWVTHLLSPAPTEFHVYLALKHNKPIYVGTSVGLWVVEEGKVRFLENRER